MNYTLHRNFTSEKTRFHLLHALALILAALLGFSFSISAKTYTANLNGAYNDANIWTPAYPGNIIQETDTIVINNDVKLTTDIVVKGTVLVRRTGSFMGNNKMVVLPSGRFINFGTTVLDAINNRGLIYNKHILEVAGDFINSGELINQESMVVGNITDNIGLITGQGGNLISNKKLVNSQTGVIKGGIDICSNSFMNVDGGTIDSTNLSFCGHRIFRNVYLSADVRKENIMISVKNAETKGYKDFQVERSVDGVNYETIAVIGKKDISDLSIPFQYLDEEVVKSNSVFYRVKLTNEENIETFIPPVEVGNILTSKSDDQ
ncbi:MAG: hypothetical protein SH857_11055 [Chitinophagales bacterium]|nr:hypothetical protein [Chitinophagales bacterium]